VNCQQEQSKLKSVEALPDIMVQRLMESTPEPFELNQESEEYSANNMDSDCEYEILVDIKTDLLDEEDPLDLKSVEQSDNIHIGGEDVAPHQNFPVQMSELGQKNEQRNEARSKLKCPSCPKVCLTEDALEAHFDYVHQAIKCEHCTSGSIKTYTGTRSFNYHVRNQHPEISPTFPCSTCGQVFLSAVTMSRYMTTYHGNHEFKCSQCSASYKEMRFLKLHVTSKHNGQRNLACPHCEKMFKAKTYLQGHIRAVHPDEFVKTCRKTKDAVVVVAVAGERKKKRRMEESAERKFPCPKCNRSFKDNHTLVGHLRYVHGPKNLPCPYCEKMFNRIFNLNSHIKNRHSSVSSSKQQAE